MCTARQHARGSSGTLARSGVGILMIQDELGPFTHIWGSPRQLFAGVRFFLKTFTKNGTYSIMIATPGKYARFP